MISLKHLFLTHNNIKTLSNPSIFKELINLTELDLSYNEIEMIDSFLFQFNIKLLKLNLKSNKITQIESNQFNGLTNLKELNLFNNSISLINSNGFNNSFSKLLVLSITNDEFNYDSFKRFNLKYQTFIGDSILYESIYIENKSKFNCSITIELLKYKLFYNLRNFDQDLPLFFSQCLGFY